MEIDGKSAYEVDVSTVPPLSLHSLHFILITILEIYSVKKLSMRGYDLEIPGTVEGEKFNESIRCMVVV